MALARKAIKQRFRPSPKAAALMESFRQMTNDCIRIGLGYEMEYGRTPSMKKLSLLSYGEIRKRYGGHSGFALCAISKASGILSARAKSIRRGFPTKAPYLSRPILVSCYGFRIEEGKLIIHLDSHSTESIRLNSHTRALLLESSLMVRSFTLTKESLALCVSKEVKDIPNAEILGPIGIDRNLRNLTIGDSSRIAFYDMTKVVRISENTRFIIRSFKRADVRVRREIASKYGRRRRERTKQLLNLVSRKIVMDAKANRQVMVFEDIKGIRRLYMKGNMQRKSFRDRMNSAPWYELKRQTEYKGAWEGVPVITLTRGETRGTTMDCPRCGERLQVAIRGDREHYRQLWCEVCQRWWDRDVVAVLNISRKGWLRFDHSKGGAGEAVRGNPREEGGSEEPVILRVDASKLPLLSQQGRRNLALERGDQELP
jgi:putative transposase